MSRLIAIMGASGTGKSTSIGKIEELGLKGLNPKETVIINVSKKPLPFRNASEYKQGIKEGGNLANVDSCLQVKQVIEFINTSKPDVKTVVVDDAGYLMGFDVMRRSKEKGYDKWTDLATEMFSVLDAARLSREDLNFIFIFHTEKGDDGLMKIKTAGKLLDNAVYIDGLFTFILVSKADYNVMDNKVEYKFITQNNGSTTAKSPYGCFTLEIPNDLGYVIERINEYYKTN